MKLATAILCMLLVSACATQQTSTVEQSEKPHRPNFTRFLVGLGIGIVAYYIVTSGDDDESGPPPVVVPLGAVEKGPWRACFPPPTPPRTCK